MASATVPQFQPRVGTPAGSPAAIAGNLQVVGTEQAVFFATKEEGGITVLPVAK